MSLKRDDTDFVYDFYQYDHGKLVAEIEVLNKEIERFGTKSSGNTTMLAHSTPVTRSTIPRYVDSGIATARASYIGVACENRMYLKIPFKTCYKQIGIGAKSKTCVDKTDKAKAKRQENKMYMDFDNEEVSPVRRPIPDITVDNKFVTQRQMKRQPKPNAEACDEHITHVDGGVGTKSKSMIKPATYDGKSPWLDYKSHFDVCAKINDWTDTEKGLYLVVSLRGQAQGVLGNLPLNARQDFDELIRSLEERFSPSNQIELYRTQLRERRQKAAESLPDD
jgi:hypothetical protein